MYFTTLGRRRLFIGANDEKRQVPTGLWPPGKQIEYRFPCGSTNLVFGEYAASDPSRKQLGPDSFLWLILSWVQGLLKNAWLLKDHAIQCESAYLVVFQERGLKDWSTNRIAGQPKFSDGQAEGTVEFSMKEEERWTELNHRVEGYLHEKDSMGFQFMMDKGFSRFGRALQFINSARHSPNITIKISQYCSALETLFTTDSAELSHKLSERVAFFLHKRALTESMCSKQSRPPTGQFFCARCWSVRASESTRGVRPNKGIKYG